MKIKSIIPALFCLLLGGLTAWAQVEPGPLPPQQVTGYLNAIPGADPTGATNSTAALTSWIGTHKDAYIPPGTYSVCSLQLPVTGAQYLHGAGPGVVLKATANCNQPIIQATCGPAHTGTVTNGSLIVTGLPTAGMVQGGQLYGTGIAPGTTVASVDSGTQVHLSQLPTSLGATTPVITYTAPGQKIEIWGLSLDGNSPNQTQDGSVPAHGVYLVNCPVASTHDIDLIDVAGHNVYYSNPTDAANVASAPGGYEKQSITNVTATNAGVARSGTYGSCFAVTSGNKTSLVNDKCYGVKKAGFRWSGYGVQVVNGVATRYGNAGIAPVAGLTDSAVITGGSFTDGFSYTDSGVTGTASGSTLTGLSADVRLRPNGGWQNSDVVTDNGGCLPSSAPYAYISSISTDGLTVTLTGTITGTCNADTFTDTGAPDGIRLDGASNTVVSGARVAGNAGSGIDIINASPNTTVSGLIAGDNGQATTLPIGPLDGRDGLKCLNTGTASTGLNIAASKFFDDQGTHTQQYHVNLTNGCALANVENNSFDPNATLGALAQTSNATSNRIGYGNLGLSANAVDHSTVTVATTTATTAFSVTVNANEINSNTIWKISVQGTISGTNGTKLFSLNNSNTGGNGTTTLFNVAAGTSGDFKIDCELYPSTQTAWHGACTGAVGTTPVPVSFTAPGNLNFALATTFSLVVHDSSASDTFTYRGSSFKRVQ